MPTTEIEVPERMRKLPRDHRGFVVPFFVVWLDEGGERVEPGMGTPDFRVVDSVALKRCLNSRRCWLCGEPMGVRLAFAKPRLREEARAALTLFSPNDELLELFPMLLTTGSIKP
jgi:hypothetical protein